MQALGGELAWAEVMTNSFFGVFRLRSKLSDLWRFGILTVQGSKKGLMIKGRTLLYLVEVLWCGCGVVMDVIVIVVMFTISRRG